MLYYLLNDVLSSYIPEARMLSSEKLKKINVPPVPLLRSAKLGLWQGRIAKWKNIRFSIFLWREENEILLLRKLVSQAWTRMRGRPGCGGSPQTFPDKRCHGLECQCFLFLVRRMSAIREHPYLWFYGSMTLNGLHLRARAILIIFSLNNQHRHADAGEVFQIGRAHV